MPPSNPIKPTTLPEVIALALTLTLTHTFSMLPVGAENIQESKDSVASEAGVIAYKFLAKELRPLWAEDLPKILSDKPDQNYSVSIVFSLVKKDDAYKIEINDDRAIFAKSSLPELDKYALKCLKKIKEVPLDSLGTKKQDVGVRQFLAVFRTKPPIAFVTPVPAVNFNLYMFGVQRDIKRHWTPPKAEKEIPIKCNFVIETDGTVSDIKIVTTEASDESRKAAEKAIKDAAPFRELPPGSPPKVNVSFVFDNSPAAIADMRRSAARHQLSPEQLGKIPDIEVSVVESTHQTAATTESAGSSIDLSEYFKGVSEKIKNAWHLLDGGVGQKENLTFTIHRDGRQSDLKLDLVTGNNAADKSAVAAVKNISAFDPLPTGAPEMVQAKLNISTDGNFTITRGTLPPTKKVGAGNKRTEVFFPKLTGRWSKNVCTAGKPDLAYVIRLTADGQLNREGVDPAIEIYNSSGADELDIYARRCLEDAAPYDMTTHKNNSGAYLVRFNNKKMTAYFTDVPEVDWHGYLVNVQRTVAKRWSRPPNAPSSKVSLSFKLKADGTISDLKTLNSDAPADLEALAKKAVYGCVPFWPFPGDAPDVITLQINFTSNPVLKADLRP